MGTLEDHKLRNLQLEGRELSSVPTEILVAGISGLEKVDLTFTKLTTNQLKGIYRMVAERDCSRLRKINISWNNNIRNISRKLLDRAKLNQSVEIVTGLP